MEDYDKICLISRGSFGTVYLCRRLQDDNRVVIKRITFTSPHSNEEEMKAIKNEANLLSSLEHPNIIKYLDSFVENDAFHIVTEYARRGNLHDFLVNRQGSLLSQEDVIIILCQLTSAVDYIHNKKILHRDLKAQNVLLSGSGTCIIKLCDFGISKLLESRNFTSSVVGTISYMSPEVCSGKSYNASSDLWSLGCLLYFVMTLQLPFSSDNLAGITHQIITRDPDWTKIDQTCYDVALIEILSQLLCKDPIDRFSTSDLKMHPFLIRHMILLGVELHALPNLYQEE